MTIALLIGLKPRDMTATLTNTTTSTFVGYNKTNQKAPIGIISYNTTTGQVKQCEVFAPFWENKAPDTVECVKYLLGAGYGLIRYNTVSYTSLV